MSRLTELGGGMHRCAGIAAIALAAVLAGCAGMPGGEPGRAAADPASLASRAGVSPGEVLVAAPPDAPAPTAADLRWWTRFDDPALTAWVERSLGANTEVEAAAARIDEARALLRAAQGARAPQLDAEAAVTARSRAAAGGRRVEPTAALRLDWDADLWGGLRAAERAATATLAGRIERLDATRLSVAALSARAYLGWQEARLDRGLQRRARDLLRETARVVRVRFDAGLAPRLDLLRADGEVAAAEAALVAADTRVRDAERALQELAGERPGRPLTTPSAPSTLSGGGAGDEEGAAAASGLASAPDAMAGPVIRAARAPARLPADPGALPVALPLDLLRLRPDLRAAEQALRAAEAGLDEAAAAERPSLRLPGVITLGTTAGGSVLAQLAASVAAELAAPLTDGGRRAATRDAAAARVALAEIDVRAALRQALAQTEAAYVAHTDARRARDALQRAVQDADAAEQQARTLYDNGLAGFIDLLDAQRSALARRQALLRREADLRRAAVAVFEALGLLPPASASPVVAAPAPFAVVLRGRPARAADCA